MSHARCSAHFPSFMTKPKVAMPSLRSFCSTYEGFLQNLMGLVTLQFGLIMRTNDSAATYCMYLQTKEQNWHEPKIRKVSQM